MVIFHFKGIQIYLRKDQCMRLKYILSCSDDSYQYEDLDAKLNDAIKQKEFICITFHEFRWIKNNMHLSRY